MDTYRTSLIVAVTALFAVGVAYADPVVSEQQVRKVWEQRLQQNVHIYRAEFPYRVDEGYWDGYDKLAEQGFVELEIRPYDKGGTWEKALARILKVTFTDKFLSQSLPIDGTASRCGIHGERPIDRIVDISLDEDGKSIVLLAATYQIPSGGFAEALGGPREPTRYRYRLTFKYDPFLEDHNLAQMEWSPWEQEQWTPARTILSEDGSSCVSME